MTNIRLYWPLIKPLQTGLLLATGLAGYLSSRPPFDISLLLGLAASLFLAISGSTIMNMWYDRDIDAKMKRTHMRPAASGKLDHREIFGVAFDPSRQRLAQYPQPDAVKGSGCEATAALFEQLAHFDSRSRVKVARGFVEEQHFGIVH